MGFRSANERTPPSKDSSSVPSIQELTGGSNRNRSRGGGGGSLTPRECESRFGVEIYMDGLETKIQRLAKKHGADQVRQWADEGMTVDTMGKPRDMRAFRERQKQRPAEVPKDVERRNAKSVQRSRGAHHEASKAGDANVPDSVRDVISSPGKQLDSSIQRAMEDRMGDTLGDVRIHTGPSAAKACEDINARAFTVGNHIAFNHGEYDPSSAEGQHILAHELAHVRQQTGGAVSMLPQTGEIEIDPDERLEREAEETANRVMRGGKLGIFRMGKASVHVQRIPDKQSSLERFTDSDRDHPPHPIKNQSATFGTASSNDYRTNFFEAYPWLEGEVVIHHAVEQQVQQLWPELVTDSEMHSLENLRGIPKELNAEIHLSQIRKEWDDFYLKHKSPDKQQLLDKATEIDDKYGDMFEPSVRD
ncbi:eCIS core domain-containing protein [Halogeometricum borinquense]